MDGAGEGKSLASGGETQGIQEQRTNGLLTTLVASTTHEGAWVCGQT